MVSALDGLKEIDPSASIRLLSVDPKYDQSVLSQQVRVIEHPHDLFAEAAFLSAGWLKRNFGRSGRAEQAIRDEMQSSDVVIASGGDMFASDYGIASLQRHLRPLEVALQLGKKVALLGHSIGPFKTPAELAAWKKVAERCDLITLRESLSYDYVKANLPTGKARIEHTADVAFLLKTDAEAEPLFASLGLLPDVPVVGCSISGGIVNFAGANHQEHVKSWVACINHLVKTLGLQALLIPHVQEVSSRNDDRRLIAEIVRLLSPEVARRVRQASGELRATEYKALISRCDLLVAERMHAAIAGLSKAVPTFVIGYSVKAKGILIDVLGSEAAAEKSLISVGDFCDFGMAVDRVNSAWVSRSTTKHALQAASERLTEAARRNFALLHEVAN